MKNGARIAIVAALVLAGCNQAAPGGTAAAGAPDSVTINGVTYTRSGGAPAAVGAVPGAAPGVPAGAYPAAPVVAGAAPAAGTIPALGRWSADAYNRDACEELSDVQFGPTSITEFKPDGTMGETHMVYYSNITATSFGISERPGGPVAANVTLTSPSTLTVTPLREDAHKTCTLTRR